MGLDVLDIPCQVGGVTRVGGIGGPGRGPGEGIIGAGTLPIDLIPRGATDATSRSIGLRGVGRGPFGTPDHDIRVDRLGQGHGTALVVPSRSAARIGGINSGPQQGKPDVAVDGVIGPKGCGPRGKISDGVPRAGGPEPADDLAGSGGIDGAGTSPGVGAVEKRQHEQRF